MKESAWFIDDLRHGQYVAVFSSLVPSTESATGTPET